MTRLSLLPNKDPARTRRTPARVDDLAVLPVFYKLKGRIALVAGGSDAAAWKAELLAASGATVHLYAEQLDEAFAPIIEARPARFVHHARRWGADSFHQATIAIGDAETEGEAQAFYCAAQAAGVPVNVIDKPAYCQFQFGSIVNRSPTVVSISTDGAAPILGQAIRRKIETVLPAFIADWSALAARIRATVNERLDIGAPRRAFWERFVDRAFIAAPTMQDESTLLGSSFPNGKTGHVTLVGAGPGDAELLALKAMRALQTADVILFDDLVSADVLELARREAKRMLVGKRGGRTSCKQEDINAMMTRLAQAGKNVVRLKSGDPSVFGRSGEEITHLERLGIPVTIIPGITSASAMAAELGVSLTHRDHAQAVRFVTGHSKQGKLPTDVDWTAIADPKTTTIFYMGGRTASQIAARMIKAGAKPHMPVALCSCVSRSNQRRRTGTLAALPQIAAEMGWDEPILIGIGGVFATARADEDTMPQNAPSHEALSPTGS